MNNIYQVSDLKNKFSEIEETVVSSQSYNDPFYSKQNMDRLKKAIHDVETGKAILKEHDLISI